MTEGRAIGGSFAIPDDEFQNAIIRVLEYSIQEAQELLSGRGTASIGDKVVLPVICNLASSLLREAMELVDMVEVEVAKELGSEYFVKRFKSRVSIQKSGVKDDEEGNVQTR